MYLLSNIELEKDQIRAEIRIVTKVHGVGAKLQLLVL